MLNQVICVGRVVNQPKKVTTKDGFIDGFVLRLEVLRNHKNDEGVYESDLIDVVLKTISPCIESLRQGDIVGVKGHLETNEYAIIAVIADRVTTLSNGNTEEKEAK